MQLALRSDLAFVTATLTFRGRSVTVPDVLVDTGAASTVLSADVVAEAGVVLEHSDRCECFAVSAVASSCSFVGSAASR